MRMLGNLLQRIADAEAGRQTKSSKQAEAPFP